jgi:hypothetical protein
VYQKCAAPSPAHILLDVIVRNDEMTQRALLSDAEPLRRIDPAAAREQPAGSIVATDDHDLIREWARWHSAEPATGEATASGPATIDVHDGGAGIRFNFPAVARFRPISWDEWFDNLHRYQLLFVYERDEPGTTSSGRYRLVPRAQLQGNLRER